jgi:hypothetical protein
MHGILTPAPGDLAIRPDGRHRCLFGSGHVAIRMAAAVALGGALAGGLAGCGSSAPVGAPTTTSTPGTATPATSSTTPTTTSTSTTTPPAVSWPPLILAAMGRVPNTTSVPLQAPKLLPASSVEPNSAKVTTSSSTYRVALYGCPSALPVNSAGVGTGTCGEMASFYGGFGGEAYVSAAAAAAAMTTDASEAAPPQPGGTRSTTAGLGHGVSATLWSRPGAGNCDASWRQQGWRFVLTGEVTAATDSAGSWTAVATSLVDQVAATRLPGTAGVLVVDNAPDGEHTSVFWQEGADVYSGGLYHGADMSVALTVELAPYPLG